MARTKAEIGAVGLPIMGGILTLDPNKNLRGREAVRVYREMLLDEPAAGAFFTACRTMIRTDVAVTPGGSTDADKQAAEFLETCLDDMRAPFATYLRQLQSAIWAGWDVHELIYKRRTPGLSKYDDGRVGWAAWSLRRQDSLDRWEYNNRIGNVTAFVQRPAPDYLLRTIPLTKAIHLTNDDSEGSPEGRSSLRGMYRQWYFCKNVELLLGISLERFGTGVPVWEQDSDSPVQLDPDSTAFATLEDTAASLRQNEEAYIIVPKGLRFRFEPSPGLAASDFLAAIQRFRLYMLQSVMAEFIALGTEGGSYALGEKKIDLFLMALNGLQDRITDILNRHAVARLFRYNDFGTLTDLPRLTLPAIRDYDLSKLGTFVQVLAGVGAFHPTPEDEAHFRKVADLVDLAPEDLEELFTAAQPAGDADEDDDGMPDEMSDMETEPDEPMDESDMMDEEAA